MIKSVSSLFVFWMKLILVLFECVNQHIAQSLRGCYLMPFASGVKLRVVITPTVIFLLRDLVCFQHSSSLTPSTQHFVKLGCILTFEYIYAEMDFSITLTDFQAVSILQCEQRVHQTDIGVNVRHSQCLRRYIKHLRKRGGQVCFWSSCPCFILSQTNIG